MRQMKSCEWIAMIAGNGACAQTGCCEDEGKIRGRIEMIAGMGAVAQTGGLQ